MTLKQLRELAERARPLYESKEYFPGYTTERIAFSAYAKALSNPQTILRLIDKLELALEHMNHLSDMEVGHIWDERDWRAANEIRVLLDRDEDALNAEDVE